MLVSNDEPQSVRLRLDRVASASMIDIVPQRIPLRARNGPCVAIGHWHTPRA